MDKKKFTRIWSTSTSVKEVCGKTGITDQSAYYWARKFSLSAFHAVEEDKMTPTQEEIAERAAEVRKGWSPAEEERRCAGTNRVRYEVPSCTFACGRA
jgi:transposase-like protein